MKRTVLNRLGARVALRVMLEDPRNWPTSPNLTFYILRTSHVILSSNEVITDLLRDFILELCGGSGVAADFEVGGQEGEVRCE